MEQTRAPWQFWIDRGGTFTDVVARTPDGALRAHKVLSENPERYKDAALQGIRDLLGLAADAPLPASAIEAVKMGTTVATNALLERKGDRTLLVITEGFADALRIGHQNRPRLFDRDIRLPDMLYEHVLEASERLDAHGAVIHPLDEDRLRDGLQAAYDNGIRAVAIVFMHGYRFTDHETRAAAIARDIGFTQVSTSHETSPLMKLIGRGDTTVVDAYLSPILRRYVDQVAAELGGAKLMFMQSNGGLTDAQLFQGKDSILSGPAGGVVGMARTAQLAGFDKVIGFDMGGTSTDVTHFNGEYERTFETEVAGVRLRAPMMHIHTVAAGGGSILHYDDARFRVGPDSAGANPGPACYRRSGPLAVTDANVMLGKLPPDHFPRVFGPNADEALDADVVREKFQALAHQVGDGATAESVAAGFLQIAVENMANAIKKISVQRGYDITDYTLNCFGGAGGQHACLVADALGMSRVFLHPLSGVLSAFGMGLADVRSLREQAVEEELGPSTNADDLLQRLETDARRDLDGQGIATSAVTVQRRAHVRYKGTDTTLLLDFQTPDALRQDFESRHKQRFGFIMADKPLVLEAVSVEVVGHMPHPDTPQPKTAPGNAPQPMGRTRLYADDRHHDTPIFNRDDLTPGATVAGPALIIEPTATIVVEPHWRADITTRNELVLTRATPRAKRHAIGTDADPVLLEVFNNLFMSIAEQMGAVLANTAHSVNIKERLDFSCAIFDAGGNLVANAPHVPVHLGSMGESIQTVIRERADSLNPGDVVVLNAPYNGGTHLPDVTVITPVFDNAGAEILFYVGSRGHHADIGGITPGSMPPDSTDVAQEGILLDNLLLVERGVLQEKRLRDVLAQGRWPARNPDQNIADLSAQIAANEKGAQELKAMVAHYGLEGVLAYMGHVQDNAEESVRRAIDRLKDGAFTCQMDNGAEVRVTITVDKASRSATVDFTGTSDQQPNNFNAPSAIAKAAVLYVFRTLVDDDIPLNAGCLKPLNIILPPGSLLNPRPPAAVVAGNVETSQLVVDALYGALGLMAASQGTMNNFTFGNEEVQYYETICGGAGAGPDHDGASAVQTHMTNSRLTDPEVLEWRYPVRVERFAIRRGSGGRGEHSGGDGVIRDIRFLSAMTAAILSGRRRVPPHGLNGGEAAKPGVTHLIPQDGPETQLSATQSVTVTTGDRLVVETPGGGGFGSIPPERS